ncbi:MAG: hypothetical protein H6581_04740 [Bacteroidia bacterium]|nr:hypothetical protein [Bacteroidia bacterium]
MSIKTRDQLRQVFTNGGIPNQDDFANLFDSFANLTDDGIRKSATSALEVQAAGPKNETIRLYDNFNDENAAWSLQLKPDATTEGWTLADGGGTPRLFVKKANGNVGVGTLNPTEKFQVEGKARITGGLNLEGTLTMAKGPQNPSGFLLFTDASWPASSKVQIQASPFNTNNAFGVVNYDANGANAGKSFVFDLNGNLAIGGQTASQKLTINTNGAAIGVDNQSTFQAKNAAGNYEHFLWPRWSDNIMYMNFGANGFHLRNNSSASAMFVKDNLYVGLGTTDPKQRMHISGGNLGLDGKSAIVLGGWNSNEPAATPEAQLVLDGVHNMGYNLSTKLLIRGMDNESDVKAISVVDENSKELFYIKSMPINAGESYFRGKVGIGTTTPGALLDVGGFINDEKVGSVLGRLQEGNTAGDGTWLGVKGYGTDTNKYGGKSLALEHHFYGIANSSVNFFRGGSSTGGFLTFNTNDNSERLRITPEGKVGIGTPGPEQAFHVKMGITGWQGRFQNGASNIYLAHDSGYGMHINTGAQNSNGRYALEVRNASQQHFYVRDDGNVGIGTGTPDARLQVSGGTIMPQAGAGDDAGIVFPKNAFGGGGDGAWIKYYTRSGESTTFEMGTSNDGDDHIALMPSGNVGIGTNAPESKLHVNGTVRAHSRTGGYARGSVAADGQWHDITGSLNGLHAFEVIAAASVSGWHCMAHGICCAAFGDPPNNCHVTYGVYNSESVTRIEMRFLGSTYDYKLQIRTAGDYPGTVNINYSISELYV